MDDSTLEDLYSYYVAFGSTTSAPSSSVTSTNTDSTSTGATSIAVSFGQSGSLITTYPYSSPSSTEGSSRIDISSSTISVATSASISAVISRSGISASSHASIGTSRGSVAPAHTMSSSPESSTLSPSYTRSAASTSVPFEISAATSGSFAVATSPVTTLSPSAISTTISSGYRTSTGGSGPLATSVVLPVNVYFDIPLNAWVGTQDSLFYWVNSPNVSSLIATMEAGAWIHLDPEGGQYFHGFTLPSLAGTTWFIHVTVEHPDNSASLFDIKIIVEERVSTIASQFVGSQSASMGAQSTETRCSYAVRSSATTAAVTKNSSFDGANSLNVAVRSSSSASAVTTAASIVATTNDTTKNAKNGFNLGEGFSTVTSAATTATGTRDMPIHAISRVASNQSFAISLVQHLQNASTDEVASWTVTPSIAAYRSDWILFDTDSTTLFGVVPSRLSNGTMLVTVVVASQSQNATYSLTIKLVITRQQSAALPSRLLSPSFPLISLASFSSFSSSSPPSTKSSKFAGWNFTATSISRGIKPTPFHTDPGQIWQINNGTQSAWPSPQISSNNTVLNASRSDLPTPYYFGHGVGNPLPYPNTTNITATATTNSMPSFTITLWTTATAYYMPCPTCPPQATVVSVATGVTQIPVEVFKSYMPDNSTKATVTATQSATDSQASTTSSKTIEVVETLTRMVTVTTVASHEETGSTTSSQSITVVTSTVSGDFDSGRKNAASLTGVSMWVLMSMPVVVVLCMDLFP